MKITTNYQYTMIAKYLKPLLRIVDPDIQDLHYIIKNNHHLYEFVYQDKSRYIDVSNLDPYKVLNTAINTIDHYNFYHMFLTEQQVNNIFNDDIELENI